MASRSAVVTSSEVGSSKKNNRPPRPHADLLVLLAVHAKKVSLAQFVQGMKQLARWAALDPTELDANEWAMDDQCEELYLPAFILTFSTLIIWGWHWLIAYVQGH